MIKNFIVATEPNGEKILIQVTKIFSIASFNEGTKIQSNGSLENAVVVKESLSDIIEKIDGKK